MNTALDLFEAATVSLTRPISIKDRLADAYRRFLVHVREEDLPCDVCEEFRALTAMLNRVTPELRGDDSLRATVRKMSHHEAAEAASAVVRIFGALSRASTVSHPPVISHAAVALPKTATNVVPLHAAKA